MTDRPAATRYGWKLVRPDGRTRNDFRWPLTPGASVESCDAPMDGTHVCPKRPGDGLSVALTPRGLAQAGFSSPTLLAVRFAATDVAGEDDDKIRVLGPVEVVAVVDWWRALREGAWRLLGDGANLRGAYLGGADLRGAYLYRANLGGADLRGANLGGADLGGANLRGAYLGGAYLRGAYLGGAYLGGWERGPDGFARRIVAASSTEHDDV